MHEHAHVLSGGGELRACTSTLPICARRGDFGPVVHKNQADLHKCVYVLGQFGAAGSVHTQRLGVLLTVFRARKEAEHLGLHLCGELAKGHVVVPKAGIQVRQPGR